ncbi:hypothetical protein KAYACHO_82 [Mycobacterium phage KayaCho]|uniref:hypothetical protein n=1 Tax=Mycobacterium phage KayaCho TaxID=1340830 RepID=UPI0003881D82|nr:hypothetical protein N846_gp82 [Mycobacterium phage KayaCho]AGT12986.1 hypothetical protein KAYACHO_82 [Mycobacterium phage KayaCho]
MGLLPKIDLDIAHTVNEFLTLLKDMNQKLDTLIDLQRDAASADRLARATDRRQAADAAPVCGACDQIGRLLCPDHGPKPRPTLDQTR